MMAASIHVALRTVISLTYMHNILPYMSASSPILTISSALTLYILDIMQQLRRVCGNAATEARALCCILDNMN